MGSKKSVKKNIKVVANDNHAIVEQTEHVEQKDKEVCLHNNIPDEYKEIGVKYNTSKFEYDLYHEERNVVHKIIQVKRFGNLSRGEKWKVFEDSKIVLVIDGDDFSAKEKDFMRTVNGFNFIITQFKQNKDYIEMKKAIKRAAK